MGFRRNSELSGLTDQRKTSPYILRDASRNVHGGLHEIPAVLYIFNRLFRFLRFLIGPLSCRLCLCRFPFGPLSCRLCLRSFPFGSLSCRRSEGLCRRAYYGLRISSFGSFREHKKSCSHKKRRRHCYYSATVPRVISP